MADRAETLQAQAGAPPGGYGGPPAGGYGGPPPGGYGGPPPGGYGGPPPGGYVPPGAGGYAGPGGAYSPPQAMGPPEHEFGEVENEVIRKAAYWAKAVAIAMFASAGLSLVGCYVTNILAFVAVGIPTFMAGNALQKVADTQGRDVTNMMEAVQSLGTSFLVRIVSVAIIVGLTVLLLVAFVAMFGMIAAMVAGAD